MERVGRNIKKFRQERKLSQKELADMTGYKTASMISQIEAGKQNLPLPKIIQIAEALNVPPGDLMGWNEDVKILSWDEEALLASYRSLNERSKQLIRDLADDYRRLPAHTKDE